MQTQFSNATHVLGTPFMKGRISGPIICKGAGVLVLALLWGNSPAVRAQSPNPEAPRMLHYGVVETSKLPHGRFGPRKGNPLPFLVPDLASFLQDKANANSGRPGGGGGGGSVLATVVQNKQATPSGSAGMSVNDSSVGAVPPDTQVSVGPNCIVEAVNDTVRTIGRGSPPCPAMDIDLYSFFGAGFFTDVVSDPIILYDAASGHFLFAVVTLETLLNQADWRFGISQTSDPTGLWNLYIATFTGSFPDFPKIGFSDDKVAITGDSFTISTQTFQGTEFLILNKADLINDVANPGQQFFGPNQGLAAIEPANSLSSTSTLYMAASGSSRKGGSIVRVWSINGVPGVSTLNVTHADLPIGALKTPPDAVQAGSSTRIVTNDTNLLNAVYRNGKLWVSGSTACTPAGDSTARSCAHFTEISTSGSTPSVVQDFTFGQNGQYYYYPAIQIDSNDNLIAVLNRSSSTEFPSVVASGQKTGDGANTFEEPVVLKEGEVAYSPSSASFNRWGDYSGAALDPLDQTVAFLAGEYSANLGNFFEGTGNDNWGTWIGEIHF